MGTIIKAKDRVYKWLEKASHLRDDDNKLIANIWCEDIVSKGYSVKDISGHFLLKLLAEHKLTSTESIRRSRCKVQEDNPHLRGHKYNKRMAKQKEVKSELGYNVKLF
tara:strand:+ start:407 stop:730 length:324 start_codon:yes stop_codon:yes gene_type:complete